jgi:hypothetical protein
MKRLLIASLLFANSVYAEQCVIQEKTVSQGSVVIQERSGVRQEVVPLPNGLRRCQVSFRARIGADWHTAFGEYDWSGDWPREQACGVAVKHAEDAVRARVGQSRVISEKVLVCRDQPDLNALRIINPGTMGRVHQFRPHPSYPNRFWHNGAQCRMFLDSAWTGRDIRTYQGVICQVQDSKWVVVDKF